MSCQVSRTFENRAQVVETTSGEVIMLRKAVRGRAYRAQRRPMDVDATMASG